ncbi:hypothetical protein LCGC14_0543580 [marine sediment metagenome]|uniref:Uncharacterized protein n=1 Tax=marine sediment metagenome TaxID=412755 RepID=A0A0F9RWS6_9ZZZZ
MKVTIYHNTDTKRWGKASLRVNQTLIWAGPLFILIQPSTRRPPSLHSEVKPSNVKHIEE